MAGLETAFTTGRPVWPLAGSFVPSRERDDPGLDIPVGSVEPGHREAHHRHVIRDQSVHIQTAPTASLVPEQSRRQPGAKRKWSGAVVASCIFHAAIAGVFGILAATEELVLIEGSDFSGVAMLGSSSADQVSAGEQTLPDAMTVTMVTMLQANPVETLEAETVPVETVETIPVDVAPVERVEAVRETEAQPAVTAERHTVTPVERVEPVEAEPVVRVAAARIEPDILAIERPEIVDDTNTVQEAVDSIQAEPVDVTATETVTPPSALPVPAETVDKAEPEQVVPADSEIVEKLPEEVVKPEPKPVEVAQAKPKPVEKKVVEKKPAKPAKSQEKPVEKQASKQAKAAGNGGRNQTDARRGQTDGKETGDSAQASRGGSRNGEAGNAAASNYKGKVVQKLKRAARSSRSSGRGSAVVTVSFSVTPSGGVRGVNASGDASLRAEGIKLVNRAAPFPPPPPGAPTDFQFPLEIKGR